MFESIPNKPHRLLPVCIIELILCDCNLLSFYHLLQEVLHGINNQMKTLEGVQSVNMTIFVAATYNMKREDGEMEEMPVLLEDENEDGN